MTDAQDDVTHCTLLAHERVSLWAARQKKLRHALGTTKIDALLVSNEKDIQYLTGFIGHDSLLIVTSEGGPSGAVIISDSRYDEFLDPWRKSRAADVVMGTRHRLFEAVRELCQKRQIARLGIQAEHITLLGRGKLAAAGGQQRLVETAGLVGALRMRKDEMEIRAIERAVAIQQEAMTA